MNSNKLLSIILSLLLFMSCSDIKKEYDSNGILLREGRMVDGVKEGEWKNFSSTGELTEVNLYEKGELRLKRQYSSDGLSVEETYINGLKNGPFKLFWEDGTVQMEGEFKEDNLHGKKTDYYPNGNVEAISFYQDGNPIGEYKYFYRDGTIQIEAESFGEGEHHVYDSLGNREFTVMFENFAPMDTIFSE